MTISVEDLQLGAVDSGIILTSIEKASAFQTLGRKIALVDNGVSVGKLSGFDAYGVGEGESKTAAGSLTSTIVGKNKLAQVAVNSEEAWLQYETISNAVFTEQPLGVAKTFDAIVAGLKPVPASWSNFGTLASATEAEIGTGADAASDFDDAIGGLTDSVATGLALSTSFLAYLRHQRISSGARAFEFTGDINSGTIEGIPYATFASSSKIGFLGNFNNYVFGNQEFVSSNGTAWRIKDAGTITDSNGTTHNLTDSNKLAIFYEVFVGSGIADLASFAKLVPAAS